MWYDTNCQPYLVSQVYAAIREWETGRYVSAHFSANIFADIYRNHVTHLLEIQSKNGPAYESLMRRLFRLASYVFG